MKHSRLGLLIMGIGIPIALIGFVLMLLAGFKVVPAGGYIGPLFFAGVMMITGGFVIFLRSKE